MRGSASLRHQLVTREQNSLFDYWQEICDAKGALPTRSDIDPARIVAHLPFVTLCERDATAERFNIRLAGTGFWNFYGSEITGRAIDDLPIGEGRAYWNRVLSHVSATGLPMAGTCEPNTPVGSHLRQFWLRLPIASASGKANLVLGYDQFLKSPAQQTSRLMRPVFGHGTPMLATV